MYMIIQCMYFCRPSGEGDLRANAIMHYLPALHYRATHGEVCRLAHPIAATIDSNAYYHI